MIKFSPMYDPFRSGGGEYAVTARHFIFDQEYYTCRIGSFSNCLMFEPPTHPGAYPFILHIVFMIIGLDLTSAIIFNIILALVIPLMLFIIFKIVFNNEEGGLFASFIFIFFRSNIAYAGTAEVATFNTFIIVLTMIFMFLFFKKQSINYLMLFVASLFFAISTKPENILIIVIFFIGLFLYNNIFSKKFDKNKVGVLFLIIFILGILTSIHITYNMKVYPEYFLKNYEEMYSFNNFANNSKATLNEIFHFPIITSILFFLGVISIKNYSKEKILFLIWTFMMIIFFTSFHQEDIQRYILPSLIGIAIIASTGVLFLKNIIFKKINISIKKNTFNIIIILLLVFSFLRVDLLFVGDRLDLENVTKNLTENDWIIIPTWNTVQVINFESDASVMILAGLESESFGWLDIIKSNLNNDSKRILFLHTEVCPNLSCEYILRIFDAKLLEKKINHYSLYQIKKYN